MNGEHRWAGFAALATGLIWMAGYLLAGCGGPPELVQRTITVTSTSVADFDARVGPVYRDTRERCREESATWEERDQCVGAWEELPRTLGIARSALHAAQHAAEAWDDGAEEGARWTDVVPCLAAALGDLVSVATAIGFQLPAEIDTAIGLATSFGGSCDG